MRKRDDLDNFHQNDYYAPNRIVDISGDITEELAAKACKNILAFDLASDNLITIFLNSGGGCVYSGNAIYDTIRGCRSPVLVIGRGHVMSMAAIILQAADHRILTPNCTVMIHHGSVAIEGNKKDVESAVFFDRKQDPVNMGILLEKIKEKKPRFTLKQLDQLLSKDTYMTATEAVSFGLADRLSTEDD